MLSWSLQLLFVNFFIPNILAVGETKLICTSSDSKRLESCNCTVEGMSHPTRIYLCHLGDRDFRSTKGVMENAKGPQQRNPSSINVLRYFILNAFRRIESYPMIPNTTTTGSPCSHLSLTSTNCPSYSTCCLVSCVSFECNDQRGSSNDAACIAPQLNADAYGHFAKWNIRQPSSKGDMMLFKGSVAVIQMIGGPCYFCTIRSDGSVRDLYTLIGMYCDERIVDQGHPVIVHLPSNTRPRLVFSWNTSQACYEFNPPEVCLFGKNICKDKTFSCSSKHYHFRFPFFANHSITTSIDNVEYTFGFCAKDVDCSSTKNLNLNTTTTKNIMICKKMIGDNQAHPVAYYTDKVDVIIRPTGFVWRIISKLNNSLKAVVSFQCGGQEKIDINVVEEEKLPLLLKVSSKCFCPNPEQVCQAGQQPTNQPHKKKPALILETTLPCAAVFVIAALFCFFCCAKRKTNEENSNRQGSTQTGQQDGPTPNLGTDPGGPSSSSQDGQHPSQEPSITSGRSNISTDSSSSYHTARSNLSSRRTTPTSFGASKDSTTSLDCKFSHEKSPLLPRAKQCTKL